MPFLASRFRDRIAHALDGNLFILVIKHKPPRGH